MVDLNDIQKSCTGPSDLIIEPIYAVRTWDIVWDGGLNSLHQHYTWHDGQNIAKCQRYANHLYNSTTNLRDRLYQLDRYAQDVDRRLRYLEEAPYHPRWIAMMVPLRSQLEMIQSEIEHVRAALDNKKAVLTLGIENHMEHCACGFYAWNDFRHAEGYSYLNPMRAAGVIEVTGRVLIGSKGLRGSKAEIKALYLPGADHKVLRAYLGADIYSSGNVQSVTRLCGVVRRRYSGATFFKDPAEMLREYPMEPLKELSK